MRIRMLLMAVLALVGTTLTGGPASAAQADPPIATGAVFSNPRGTTAEKNAIKNHIIGAIGNTQSGRLIRASLYALTDQGYADALTSAHTRGVNIRVVLDSKFADRDAARNLIAALGTDRSARSWVQVCTENAACIGNSGSGLINHNKFFTFSRIGDAGEAEDVVIQTSANQTPVNTDKYWNNAYTVVGNTALYTAYVGYFDDLAAMKKNSDYFTQGKVGTEKYYFFPQRTGDIVVSILSNLSCADNGKVSVAAFALHRDEVAAKLKAMAGQGCSIRVVYHDSNDAAELTGHRNIDLRRLSTSDGYLVHSKYVLIEGTYAGHADTKWTFTGSHNLDYSSLRENDEALLRLEGAAPYDAYLRDFTSLQAAATKV
ncbi:phospholipase D-like domain-containing protein [Streptomyces sp. NPDC095613]|uniref:phospholipase D-like domain-containing protein n=1 Tax=Streptomyces sp. NPDC095613 TaxID=3155540 RepID=UPI00332584D7